MESDLARIRRLTDSLTPRKLTILGWLSGLNAQELKILRLKSIEGLQDWEILNAMNITQSTLTRKKRRIYQKIYDALNLYGYDDLRSLPLEDIFSYVDLFYQAQDQLVLFFIRNNRNRKALGDLLAYLSSRNARTDGNLVRRG